MTNDNVKVKVKTMKMRLLLFLAILAMALPAQARYVKYFNTIANLLAADVRDVSTVAIVNQFDGSTDGGAIFYYSSASTAATNATTVFAPNSGTGRWIRAVVTGSGTDATELLSLENEWTAQNVFSLGAVVEGTLQATNIFGSVIKLDAPYTIISNISLPDITAPGTPSANGNYLWASNGLPMWKDDAGVSYNLAADTDSASIVWDSGLYDNQTIPAGDSVTFTDQLAATPGYIIAPWRLYSTEPDVWWAAVEVPTNSASSAGVVASGSGQASKVWSTDASGVPGWRDPTGGSATVDTTTNYTWTGAHTFDGVVGLKSTNIVGWYNEAKSSIPHRFAVVDGRVWLMVDSTYRYRFATNGLTMQSSGHFGWLDAMYVQVDTRLDRVSAGIVGLTGASSTFAFRMPVSAAPGTPDAGHGYLYSDSSGKLMWKNPSATYDLTEGSTNGGAGNIVGTGTPTQYALPTYSDTTGTNIEPSSILVTGGTNLTVPGEMQMLTMRATTLVVSNAIDGVTITNSPRVALSEVGTYGDGWSNSVDVPTKGAVYAHIQTLGSGGTITYDIDATNSVTDATPFTLQSIAIASNTTFTARADVIAGGDESFAFEVRTAGRDTNGTITLFRDEFSEQVATFSTNYTHEDLATNAWFDVSGGYLRLRSQGMADESLNIRGVGWVYSVANAVATGPDYIVEENAEGSGTPDGWTDTGTVDWDYTTDPGQGSQSVYVEGASSESSSYVTFDGQSEVHAYAKVKVLALPGADRRVLALRDADGNLIARASVRAAGTLRFYHGTASATTVSTITTNEWFHLWIGYTAGSGSDGVGYIAFSSDGSKPSSGDAYKDTSSGTGTADISRIVLNAEYASGYPQTNIFDRILVHGTAIGSNP